MKIIVSHSENPVINDIYMYIENKIENTTVINWNKKDRPLFSLLESHKDVTHIVLIDKNCEIDKAYKFVNRDRDENNQIKLILIVTDESIQIDQSYFANVMDINKIPRAANYLLYDGGKVKEKFKTDLLLITDYVDVDNHLFVQKIRQISTHYNLKCFGKNKLNLPEYLGQVGQDEYKDLLASCKMLLSYDLYWDINAMIYNMDIVTSHIQSNGLLVYKHMKSFIIPLDYTETVRGLLCLES